MLLSASNLFDVTYLVDFLYFKVSCQSVPDLKEFNFIHWYFVILSVSIVFVITALVLAIFYFFLISRSVLKVFMITRNFISFVSASLMLLTALIFFVNMYLVPAICDFFISVSASKVFQILRNFIFVSAF